MTFSGLEDNSFSIQTTSHLTPKIHWWHVKDIETSKKTTTNITKKVDKKENNLLI